MSLLFFVALRLQLGYLTIVVSHVTFCVNSVTMVGLGRLQDFDWGLVEAAQDFGAGTWTTARRVVLPLPVPGIASGALLAFTLWVDDFVITFFAGPGTITLPLRIYSMIKHGSAPFINALSTLLLALTVETVWLSQRLIKEKT